VTWSIQLLLASLHSNEGLQVANPWLQCQDPIALISALSTILKFVSKKILSTLTSSGWSQSVQLGGTRTKRILFCQKQITTCLCNLSFKFIKDGKSYLVIRLLKFLTLLFDKTDDDSWDVIDHGSFIAPMAVRMSNVPIFRKLDIRVALNCFTLAAKVEICL